MRRKTKSEKPNQTPNPKPNDLSRSAISMEEETLKPGQKYPTPTPGNGDRVFYETLFRQRPDSEMAQEW